MKSNKFCYVQTAKVVNVLVVKDVSCNHFSIKPTVVWVKISQKQNIRFSSLRSRYKQASKQKETYFAIRKVLENFEGHGNGTDLFTMFQSGQNNGVKLWVFDEYSVAFPYKVSI